jgi:hypothetical protein
MIHRIAFDDDDLIDWEKVVNKVETLADRSKICLVNACVKMEHKYQFSEKNRILEILLVEKKCELVKWIENSGGNKLRRELILNDNNDGLSGIDL